MKICTICRNLLLFDDNANFVCTSCGNITKMLPEDSMIYNDNKLNEVEQYGLITKGSPYDPTTKKSIEKCRNCGDHFTIAHLGVNEQTVFLCTCGKADRGNTSDKESIEERDDRKDRKDRIDKRAREARVNRV